MRKDEVDILACYRQDIRNLPNKGKGGSLVLDNLPLVVSIARSYSSSRVPLLDLIQAGNEGLMRAATKFDPQLGFQFSTYATKWIKHFMMRLVLRQASPVAVPFYLLERLPGLRQARESMLQQGYEEPGAEQLAQVLGYSVAEVQQLQEIEQQHMTAVSLEAHQFADGSSFADLLFDVEAEISAPFELRQRNTELSALLQEVLSDEERTVILLHCCAGLTHSEIGRKLGRAYDTIRRIADRALLKLRHPVHRQRLEGLL